MTREWSTGISKGYVSGPHSRCHPHSSPCFQPNILIDNNGRACLADFGLVVIVPDRSTPLSSFVGGGTVEWMSPELLNPEDFNSEGRPTKESDCYALGMVIYEVLSGRTPFAPSTVPPVIWKVLNGERPERPRGEEGALFTDNLWEILGHCWKQQPGERTRVKIVLQYLKKASSLPQPRGIVETGTGEQLDATASGSGMLSLFHRRSQVDL